MSLHVHSHNQTSCASVAYLLMSLSHQLGTKRRIQCCMYGITRNSKMNQNYKKCCDSLEVNTISHHRSLSLLVWNHFVCHKHKWNMEKVCLPFTLSSYIVCDLQPGFFSFALKRPKCPVLKCCQNGFWMKLKVLYQSRSSPVKWNIYVRSQNAAISVRSKTTKPLWV